MLKSPATSGTDGTTFFTPRPRGATGTALQPPFWYAFTAAMTVVCLKPARRAVSAVDNPDNLSLTAFSRRALRSSTLIFRPSLFMRQKCLKKYHKISLQISDAFYIVKKFPGRRSWNQEQLFCSELLSSRRSSMEH